MHMHIFVEKSVDYVYMVHLVYYICIALSFAH